MYSKIKQMIIHDNLTIEFKLNPLDESTNVYDPELPMVIALTPVFSKKQLDAVDFQNLGLTPLIGTGPYKIDQVKQGRSISFKKDEQYWAKDAEFNKGKNNFDNISIEYYKNAQSWFRGFLAKSFDVFFETNPEQWRQGYNTKAVEQGDVVLSKTTHNRPVAVQTIIMNMRRPLFQNLELRRAIVLAFDADTLNHMLFDGEMGVPHSLFANTELAHQGPAEKGEIALYSKYKDQIPKDFYERLIAGPFTPAQSDGHGNQRQNIKDAADILDKAGYHMKNGKRCTPAGEPIEITLMIKDEKKEKIALSLRESLKKLGITLIVRKFDANQYENRVLESDFDMIIHTWANSLSPGFEQAYFFGVKTADVKGSSNYIGVKDPIAESLAVEVSKATTWDELKTAVHALDRYVMHLCLQIPVSYDNKLRVAYWKDRVAFPALSKDQDMDVMVRGWMPR
jgi:microcin C transport system substrate-binding protein